MDGKLLIGGGVALGLVGLVLLARRSTASPAPGQSFYPDLPDWRRDFLGCVFDHAQAATPYQWGGGHGQHGDYGVDCSGLVNVCAHEAGMNVAGNADWYYHDLPAVAAPTPGDLALYGSPARATHIRVVTAWHPDEGRAEAIGAEGGGPSVTSPETAAAQNAFVRRVDDHRAFGGQFLGFRSLVPYAGTPGVAAAPMMPTLPG